ncbi:MAG: phosphomannomutase, partial [Thermoprotei archaeon]
MPSRLSSPFRAYDIRGIYGENLTDEFAQKLGYALGKFVKERKVSVGRDSRYSSPILAENLIKGIAASGKEVDYVGEVPNPITYFYCWREKIPGAYVTASHNPPQYNGFKLIRGDGTSFTHEYSELKK